MKGRPYASYQIGKILYSNSSLSDLESGMAAKAYKNSKKYLEKAFNEECIFDVDEELKRLTQDLETVIYPAIIGLMNRRGGHRLEQADLDDMKKRFHVASKAGNREAKFNYLNLAISEKNQVDENRFKLGKLYLSGTTTSHPKKNVVEAQKLLESAARNGHVKAAVLVAQHYCSYTPHQPKFKSSDLIYQVIPENPNDIALEFLKIAVKSGLKKEKAKIAENKMPEYLIQIAKQLDPSAMEMVFSLNEQYEKIHFKTDDDVKLANFLYKMALDAQYPAALNKLRAQEQKLAKELAIKLQRKMNDLQNLEKSGL
jgi:TPR repeat protein